MDTPKRTQNETHISKIEDSPVFNFINNLSPIKPVKSTHVTQTLNSLSFSSLPSVFTSPHLTSQKDSKLSRRHTIADPTKLLVSFDKNGDEENLYATQIPEHVSSFGPLNEELKKMLKYDSTSYCGIEDESVLAMAESSTRLVPYNLIVSEQRLLEGEQDSHVVCEDEKRERETECEWDSLISNATELVNFYSPDETRASEGTIQISRDYEGNNDLDESQLGNPIYPCTVPKAEDPSTQPEEVVLGEASTSKRLSLTNDPSDEMDSETVSNMHHGPRRRCLVFEMRGARAKNFINSSTSSSSMVSQCNAEIASIDNQLVPKKRGSKTSRRLIPGIGLHLNALTQTPNNLKPVKHETLATGEQPDVHNSSMVHSPKTGEIVLNSLLVQASCESDTNLHGNDNLGDDDDGLQAPSETAPEDSDQISSKKKRSRFEHAGENEGCKRCNCKKSKCLKLYCECFAAGVYCIGPCSCQECFNKPIHEETVLATRKQIETRNPLAFAPKVIGTSDYVPDNGGESNQTPASARHKRGCNCKKSGCLKKYCECYQSGVGCSINCRCESCKNAFGIKEGYCPIETEAEPDEEETLGLEKTTIDNDLRKPIIQNNDEHNAAFTHPSTPLHLSRLSTQMPFSSKSKLQRSLTIGSSIGLQHCPKLTYANFLRPQPRPDKNIHTIPKENEIPQILQTDSTSISGMKSGSPNSKRVSPPHSNFGSSSSSSPGRRSSRKLILQSIPSFPSLNSQL